MRFATLLLILAVTLAPAVAEESDGPSNEKAQKTYQHALEYLHQHMTEFALGEFKKADKQDDGHCLACQKQMIKNGIALRDWKTAEFAAQEMVSQARDDKGSALAHYQYGLVLINEGWDKHKQEIFARAHDQFVKALELAPNFPAAVFGDGRALALMKRDDEAVARFKQFAEMRPADDPDRDRALLFVARPGLARARMAPPFIVTTTDGQKVSLDGLKGKVVLIDFWATWCGPCRQAMPRIRDIAKDFQGEPFFVLSVSLDDDQQKWKDFVSKNEMTWPQYCDGGFSGELAKLFGVHAIPHTFAIDADGVLQDEEIGDASIEGKLKKLIDRARQLQESQSTSQQK